MQPIAVDPVNGGVRVDVLWSIGAHRLSWMLTKVLPLLMLF